MYTKLKAFISITIISLSLFVIPVSLFLSTDNLAQPVITVQENIAYANSAECGVGLNSSILACIPGFFKMTTFWPAYYITKGAGMFFDFFMDYSVSSQTYSQGVEFVTRGWAAVRDIANIFFIFVLLYIAIGTILNLSQVKTKKMLVKVIIVALLINFSLFFTRVVIDASNILARAFVSSIDLQVTDQNGDPVVSGPTQYSAAVIAGFNPSSVLSTDDGLLNEIYSDSSANGAAIEVTFIFVLSAILYIMSFVFVMVGIMMLGRVIELWYLMIIAPIAFISIVLPFNIPKLGWDAWLKSLVSTAFVAPVFMFFLYLIITFLNLGLDATTFDPSGGMWSQLLQIIIPFVIILVLILKAKTIAVKMSGEVGAVFAKAGGAVAGLGVAALSGGASLALQSTVGRAGAGMANSTRSGFAGRMQRSMGNKIKGGSMDWRKTSSGQSIMKGMGMSSTVNKFQPSGGVQGIKDRYAKGREEDTKQRIENEKASSPEAAAADKAKGDVTMFENKFAETIRGFEEAIKEQKEELSLAPESEKSRLAGKLTASQDEFKDFKSGKGNYDSDEYRLQTGVDDKGAPVMKSLNGLKDNVNKSEDAVKKIEVDVRQKAAGEMRDESFFTTGLTGKERDSAASSVERNTGKSSGNKKREKKEKPKEKEKPKDDDK